MNLKMSHFLQSNAAIFSELNFIKQHLLESNLDQKETDKKIEKRIMVMMGITPCVIVK